MGDKKVVATVTFNRGSWSTTNNTEWNGFYFVEAVLDWSLFRGCVGKLYVETMHATYQEPGKLPWLNEGGWLRLAYQQGPEMIPVAGSEIKTYAKHVARWQLLESPGWFPIPNVPDVSCLWIEGRAEEGKNISVALATLVIAEDD